MAKKSKREEVKTVNTVKEVSRISAVASSPKFKYGVIAVLVLVVIGLLAFKNTKTFLAATVNNKPIFTWEMNSTLQKKYASKLLDRMIDTILVRDEAKKENIQVTKQEITDKYNQLETQIGGKEAVAQLLTNQGMTQEELNETIELQLIIDKILEKKVPITDTDITDYMTKNKDSLPATDSASQKVYAANAVKQQKFTDYFTTWYGDLKTKSKIFKFY